MKPPVPARVEAPFALVLIALAGLMLIESRHIAPTVFDALGSSAVPLAVAGLIVVLSLAVLARTARRKRATASGETAPTARRLDALMVLLLTAGFVAAMQAGLLSFGWLATAYLVLTIGWLERFAPARLPYVVVLAAVAGFGLQYVFTRIFIVNLPGL